MYLSSFAVSLGHTYWITPSTFRNPTHFPTRATQISTNARQIHRCVAFGPVDTRHRSMHLVLSSVAVGRITIGAVLAADWSASTQDKDRLVLGQDPAIA